MKEKLSNMLKGRSRRARIKLSFVFFFFLIFIICLQTYLTIVNEREYMIESAIDEKVMLAETAAMSIGSAEVHAVPAHKREIVRKLAEPDDIVYCRIVKPTGEIYLSNIVEERGVLIRDRAIKTDKTVIKTDIYGGEEIKVVVTPSYRGHTVWLGFSLEKVYAEVWSMIWGSLVIGISVISIAILVFYGLISFNKEVSRANRELRDTQEQLIHSEKLAALGRLSADIAHEINNPLSGIKNSLYLLSDSVSENKKGYLEIAEQEVDRISGIVQKLLDLYRPKKEILAPTNVNVPLDDILEIVKKQFANRSVRIIKDFDQKLPAVMASSEHLKQVFLNLILNAVEAMPEGGDLTIKTYSRPAGSPEVIIEFTDTGCGIPEEEIDKIFDPFFTTKKGGKGTGLGLSVSYGIIKRYDGIIEVRSKVGRGTTFNIILPIVEKKGEENERKDTHSG